MPQPCPPPTPRVQERFVPYVTPVLFFYIALSATFVLFGLYTLYRWVRVSCDEVSKPSWCSFLLNLMGFFLMVKAQITTSAHTEEHKGSPPTLTPLLTKSSVAFEAQLLFSLRCLRKGLCSSKSHRGWSKQESTFQMILQTHQWA